MDSKNVYETCLSPCHGFHTRRKPIAIVVALLLLLPTFGPALAQDTPASAGQVSARFAFCDSAAPGQAMPLVLDVVNTSADTVSRLEVRTNQTFAYRFDVTIPAGQTRAVSFASWFFEVNSSFDQEAVLGSDAHPSAGGRFSVNSLRPDSPPASATLLFFEQADLGGRRFEDHLGTWALYYSPPSAGAAKRSPPSCLPARFNGLTAALLKDSAADGLVVSAERSDLGALRRLAVASGLDLWTLSSGGEVALAEAVPPVLRRLADRTHVRPDLFDTSAEDVPSAVPPMLFRVRAPDWSMGDRLTLVVPLLVTTALLVCLALLGFRLPRRVRLAAVALIVIVGAVWVLLAVRRMELVFVDTVTVTVCDSASGRAYTEHLAAARSLRSGSLTLRFDAAGSGPPRPLMFDDTKGRPGYRDVVLHRNLEGLWSVGPLGVVPGVVPAFGVGRWEAGAFAPGDVMLLVQSGAPRVRLKKWRRLDDAYLFVYSATGSWASRMAADDGQRLYDSPGGSMPIDRAVRPEEAPPSDAFRRRAMLWIDDVVRRAARESLGSEFALFFGWEPSEKAVAADGARMADHDRLVIYVIARGGGRL